MWLSRTVNAWCHVFMKAHVAGLMVQSSACGTAGGSSQRKSVTYSRGEDCINLAWQW